MRTFSPSERRGCSFEKVYPVFVTTWRVAVSKIFKCAGETELLCSSTGSYRPRKDSASGPFHLAPARGQGKILDVRGSQDHCPAAK